MLWECMKAINCLNILKQSDNSAEVIRDTGVYGTGIQTKDNYQTLTTLGKILAASSTTKYA